MEQTKTKTYNPFQDFEPAKRFNIEEFNLKSKGEDKYRFTDDKGVEVYQFTNPEFPSGKIDKYWENRSYPNSGYEFVCSYNVNGLLFHSLVTFHSIQFGIIQYYDSSGNVIKEKNLDAPYTFSLDNVIDKMKDEYKIDICISELMWDVNRYVSKKMNIPLYEISAKDPVINYKVHIYLIDGNTGETLLITSRNRGSRHPEETIIEEYIRKRDSGELAEQHAEFLKKNAGSGLETKQGGENRTNTPDIPNKKKMFRFRID